LKVFGESPIGLKEKEGKADEEDDYPGDTTEEGLAADEGDAV
jgi:hypothetical protein